MSKISVQPHSNAQLQTPAKFLSILDASHTFIITVPDNGDVVGATGRQYELDNVSYVTVDNPSDDVLEIEFERSNIRITAIADGNVKVINKLKIDSIEDEVSVLARTEIGQEINTLNDIEIQPHSSQLIINASANRAELMAKNISATPAVLRFGGAQVSNSNGIPVVQNGTFVLSNGAALYAYNTSDRVAKVSLLEVMQ